MFRTIVLAVDGSKHSEKAVELTKHLAAAGNGYVAELGKAGVTARVELRSAQYGGVAQILTNLAEDLDAGLVVMGSHGRGT